MCGSPNVKEINWLDIRLLKTWRKTLWRGFCFDNVSNEDIRKAVLDPKSRRVNPMISWEDDDCEDQTYKIASIARSIKEVGLIHPIELDTFVLDKCSYGIYDGHHRIRALQFLGCEIAPFSLNGHLDILEDLVKHAGCEFPKSFKKLFSERLVTNE